MACINALYVNQLIKFKVAIGPWIWLVEHFDVFLTQNNLKLK